MDGGVTVEYQLWKVIRPGELEFRGKSAQQVMHGPVELVVPFRFARHPLLLPKGKEVMVGSFS